MGGHVATLTDVNTNKFAFVLKPFAFAEVDGGSLVFQDFENTAEVGEKLVPLPNKHQNVVNNELQRTG